MAVLENASLVRIVHFSVACAVFVTALGSGVRQCRDATEEAQVPADDSARRLTAAIELREGLAISAVRERRAAINIDPIVSAVVAGTWAMPRSGDASLFREGRSNTGSR